MLLTVNSFPLFLEFRKMQNSKKEASVSKKKAKGDEKEEKSNEDDDVKVT